jgi:hypothetical protein
MGMVIEFRGLFFFSFGKTRGEMACWNELARGWDFQ